MKNSNEESLERKALSDKELYSDSASEKTEDEIIYNNCIDEEEEEFLETDLKNNPNVENKNSVKKNKISKNHPKNKIPIKPIKNNSIQLEEVKSTKNKFQSYYSPKFDFFRKKRKKGEEVKTADDLFVQALQKNKGTFTTNKEYDEKGNTMSTKISDIIYSKLVGKKGSNLDNIDISKIKDEEFHLNRENKRNKDEIKKVYDDMINRQDKFQKNKENKRKERENEMNEKLNQECNFMPNGISTSSRTPQDFYLSQIKFLAKKEESINNIHKKLKENEKENKRIVLTSKASEKIANSKNPNETKDKLYERLHFEKLKNVKENVEKPKEERKLPKKHMNNLFDKLYNERRTLKENQNKREKVKSFKEKKPEELISDNSNLVLLNKFLNYYENKLMEIFNRKDNFEINIDEYKLILISMGCVNPNLQSDEVLIKESFFNILNPKNDKIETNTLLLFCLATLGLYKGNDEPKQSPPKEKNNNQKKSENRLSGKKSQQQKIISYNELIKSNVPNMDLNKYGFSNKTAKTIYKKFLSFVKGINDSWTGDITKKKQERQERFETSKDKKTRAFSKGKDSSKLSIRKSQNKKNIIPNMNHKNIINKDNNKSNTVSSNNKYDEIYKRLQQRKDNNLTALRLKKAQEELAPCTFQPNIHRKSKSKDKDKNKNKLNKEQIDNNFEKLYREGKASYLQKKQSIDPDFDDNLDNQMNCTFKPIIHQFNNEVFTKNPIKEELQKFEKIRDHKLSIIGNKKHEKPMNFVIESKINKEDIVDRVLPERYNVRNDDTEKDERDSEIPLLKVEVNLDENNNSDKIIIYPGDDVKEKTIQFCIKHRLNEEKKNTLLNIIMDKIEETKNRENNFNEGIKTEKNKENKNNKQFDYMKNNINDIQDDNEEDNQIIISNN